MWKTKEFNSGKDGNAEVLLAEYLNKNKIKDFKLLPTPGELDNLCIIYAK